jgi:hypothetical protein
VEMRVAGGVPSLLHFHCYLDRLLQNFASALLTIVKQSSVHQRDNVW